MRNYALVLFSFLVAGTGCRLVVGDGAADGSGGGGDGAGAVDGGGAADGGGPDGGGADRVRFEALVVPPEAHPLAYSCAGDTSFDLEGNGRQSLLLKCSDPGLTDWVMVLSLRANGAFAASRIASVSIDWSGTPATGDFDEDGRQDVVIQDAQSGLMVLRNQGGTFDTRTSLAGQVTTTWSRPALGDFDGDGHLDLALSRSLNLMNPSADLLLLRGDGKGGFTVAATGTGGGTVLGAVDVDGDGRLDLITRGLDVYKMTGALALPAPIRNGHDGDAVRAFRDLDGDGDVDALTISQDRRALRLHRGDGKGLFQVAETLHTEPGTSALVGVAGVSDVDRDGKLDLVTFTAKEVRLHFGRGDGTFESPRVVASGNDAALADLDGDQRPDLLVQTQPTINAAFTALLNRAP